MRRADVVDSGSQPVRNLFSWPSWETGPGGTTVINTNLFTNPSAETIGANWTVRTNQSVDPRQTNPGSLGPYGTQTFSAATGISGHPLGITTATRVTYTGAANPGPLLLIGPKFSTRYTLSAYVYHETVGTNATQGFAQKGITANSLVITQGVWERVSWTYTTGASGTFSTGNDFGFRVTGQTTGGSYLITGILIEESGLLNSYYDGTTAASGDFNYAWTGTANASTSVMSGKLVTSFGNPSSNRAAVISSTDWADKGTKSVRVIPGQATDGTTNASYAEIALSGLTIGKTYYISAVNRIAQPLTGTLTSDHRRVFYPGTQPTNMNLYSGVPVNTAGNVYNLSASFTASATFHNIRFQNGAPEGATNDVWWDSIMISEGAGAYFDGSTVAAGDFTYAWAGTANASISYMRGIPINGYILRYYSAAIMSSDWASSGTKSLRLVPNTDSNESFVSLLSDFGGLGGLVPGKTYTVLGTLRLNALQTGTRHGRALSLVWRENTVRKVQVAGTNTVGVQQLRMKFTIGLDATNGFVELFNGASAGNGDVWWDDVMIVEGDYTGDYVDGTKPFSKWDGTVNSSTSAGYPPQLLEFAGKPITDLSAGQSLAPNTVDGFAARTFYFVYEAWNNTQNYNAFASYGIAGSKGFVLQTAASGSLSMANRFDFPGGSFNGALGFGSARTSKRHVLAVSCNQGLTSMSGCTDGGSDVTVAMTPGSTGWDDGRATVGAASEGKGHRLLVFNGEHSRATRIAMSRYLGNKYGAPVA